MRHGVWWKLLPLLLQSFTLSTSTKFIQWSSNMRNFEHDCLPLEASGGDGLEVLAVVDCQEKDARYDYKYNVKKVRVPKK